MALAEPRSTLASRLGLAAEFALLFLAAPLALFFRPRNLPPLPILWAVSAYALALLWRDPAFDRRQLWNGRRWRRSQYEVWALFGVVAAGVTLMTLQFAPRSFLLLPRQRPALWALIMVAYPVLSVYPQGLLYRAFLMHRYRLLLPSADRRILVSAVAFSLMHIVFRNPVAVILTLGGGILFAKRYEETQSLCVSSYEHALYGCFLFTVGLGQYFYTAAV
jgi:hypothetical protein